MSVISGFLLRVAGDKRGNIAPLLGLMAVPLIAFAGASVDFGAAVSARAKMQQALDSASIAALAHFRSHRDIAKAQQVLKDHLAAELSGMSAGSGDGPALPNQYVLTNIDIDPDAGTLEPRLSAKIPTRLLKILRVNDIDIVVEAGAVLPAQYLDAALMVDVSGSLCDAPSADCTRGSKLDALKRSLKHFLGIVMAVPSEKRRISIVPFSSAVNVGSDYVLKATNLTTDTRTERVQCGRRTCTKTYYLTNCVTERDGTGTRNNNLPGDDRYFTPVWSEVSRTDCAPGDANRIEPLGYDLARLEARVDGLTAKGGTAGHLGAQWAWATISETWAGFWGSAHAPRVASPEVKKVAILMTDGDMTMHHLDGGSNCQGYAGTNGQDCLRSRQDLLSICASMKAQGIIVYTIGFAPDGKGITETGRVMLEACASPDKAYMSYSEEAIERDFTDIGKDVASGIRLVR